MPGRATPLVNGEIYHLFNRGNDKRDLFIQPRDYKRFLKTFYYYQFQGPKTKFSNFNKSELTTLRLTPEKRLVEIYCYCMMPNHFHFLVKQLKDNGISIFMSQLSNSYTKYFNTKNRRVGSLLQGTFKSVLVENNEQFIHLSRYIHINPIVSGITNDLDSYLWSSYHEYTAGVESFCSIHPILDLFPSRKKYEQFLKDHIEYATTIELLKHQIIEDI